MSDRKGILQSCTHEKKKTLFVSKKKVILKEIQNKIRIMGNFFSCIALFLFFIPLKHQIGILNHYCPALGAT